MNWKTFTKRISERRYLINSTEMIVKHRGNGRFHRWREYSILLPTIEDEIICRFNMN